MRHLSSASDDARLIKSNFRVIAVKFSSFIYTASIDSSKRTKYQKSPPKSDYPFKLHVNMISVAVYQVEVM